MKIGYNREWRRKDWKLEKTKKRVGMERKLSFCQTLILSISLQPDVIDLRYFKIKNSIR